MALRRLDPALAADAMAVHCIELAHHCWLARTPEGSLQGCAVGALYFAQHGDVPLDQVDLIDWAVTCTGSRAYVQGFDVGFHGFAPLEDPPDEYVLGLDDGRCARVLVDEPNVCRPAAWCWRTKEEP